jgi:hypothetical protein
MSVEKNWFESVALSNFSSVLLPKTPRFFKRGNILQIGVYTGDATCWIAENILVNNSSLKLYDVDTFNGSPEAEHQSIDFREVEKLYDSKISKLETKSQIFKYKQTSDNFFKSLDKTIIFDFVYIDGNHFADFVARDAFNSFLHLPPGGILAFDDYGYGIDLEEFEKPSIAIDFFLKAYKNQIEILIKNYQVWVIKK